MARKPSPAWVKTHRVYTLWEAAEALGVHKKTVGRWVKDQGLPADTSRKPWLIAGRDLKAFLDHRQRRSRQRLAIHQCYCLGCKGPREPAERMADYTQQTATSGMLTALCPDCGNIMHKAVRRADLDQIRSRIDVAIKTAAPRLVSPTDPPLNVPLSREAETRVERQF